jgi:hypothetical protein
MIEILIILETDTISQIRPTIEQRYTVVHSFSERTLVVRGEQNEVQQIKQMKGVLLATETEVPDAVLNLLSHTEQLSISAWQLSKEPKNRKGEGNSWDAPGFSPP